MEQSDQTARQLHEELKANSRRARFGFGRRPALVNVDLQCAYVAYLGSGEDCGVWGLRTAPRTRCRTSTSIRRVPRSIRGCGSIHAMSLSAEGSMTAAELCTTLVLEKSSISRMRKLVEAGELAEGESDRDGRAKPLADAPRPGDPAPHGRFYAESGRHGIGADAAQGPSPIGRESLASYASALEASRIANASCVSRGRDERSRSQDARRPRSDTETDGICPAGCEDQRAGSGPRGGGHDARLGHRRHAAGRSRIAVEPHGTSRRGRRGGVLAAVGRGEPRGRSRPVRRPTLPRCLSPPRPTRPPYPRRPSTTRPPVAYQEAAPEHSSLRRDSWPRAHVRRKTKASSPPHAATQHYLRQLQPAYRSAPAARRRARPPDPRSLCWL